MILQSIHVPAFPNQDRGPISGVYFIRRGESGPVKIGFSANVRKRVRSLQTGSAEPLKLLAVAEGGEQTERFLHEQFARHRLEGEWFSPDASLLGLISDLAGKSAPAQPAPSRYTPLSELRGELCRILGISPTENNDAILAEVWSLAGPAQESAAMVQREYAALRVRLAEMVGIDCEAKDQDIADAIEARINPSRHAIVLGLREVEEAMRERGLARFEFPDTGERAQRNQQREEAWLALDRERDRLRFLLGEPANQEAAQ